PELLRDAELVDGKRGHGSVALRFDTRTPQRSLREPEEGATARRADLLVVPRSVRFHFVREASSRSTATRSRTIAAEPYSWPHRPKPPCSDLGPASLKKATRSCAGRWNT